MDNQLQFRRKRNVFLNLAAAVVLAAATTPVSAQTEQNFLVEFSDDKLSIQANNTLVKDLLLEIQDKTGIPVNFVSDPKDTVSLSITDQSIEHAIAKITANHMIIHGNINGTKTISELIIISDDPELQNSGAVSANLPSGQPAPAIGAASDQPADQPIATDQDNAVPTDNNQDINQPIPLEPTN